MTRHPSFLTALCLAACFTAIAVQADEAPHPPLYRLHHLPPPDEPGEAPAAATGSAPAPTDTSQDRPASTCIELCIQTRAKKCPPQLPRCLPPSVSNTNAR